MEKIKRQEKVYQTIVYIMLAILAMSIIVPVGWAFVASIKKDSEFYGNPWALPEGFHWQNFVNAFEQANMGEYLLNSVMVTSMALSLLLIVALPAAYVLARYKFKGNVILNTLFMGGLFINVNYIVVPIFLMLVDADKVIDQLFGNKILLNNIFVVALVYAATALPFTIYLLASYLKTIPKEYEEAASVDGAGHFKTMTAIILPMTKPSIITVVLFNFLLFWNEYIIALTLMPGIDAPKTLPVGLMNLMAAQKSSVQYGRMYAGLVIVMLPTLLLYMMVQKKLTKGMMAGGLKG
ncbi:MAG: carbohydrate ABC transporter permease [Cellulosilyticaceae bacterium]